MKVRAWAPGRVNLIGEHTDYMGGLVMPMAIQLGTQIEGTLLDGRIELRSSSQPEPVLIDLPASAPELITPSWGRYVAGVAQQLHSTTGLSGTVDSNVPPGAGLSSSAALEVAVATALDALRCASGDSPLTSSEIALAAQRAEQAATGVPCGIMDQLVSASGIEGHALRIDCSDLSITPVAIPPSARIVVVHSGEHRTLDGSAYGERRAQCEMAEAEIGPLRLAGLDEVSRIDDPLVMRRARHVVTENSRVDAFAAALTNDDLKTAGQLMIESHYSLRDDFEVSTTRLDELVAALCEVDGVFGARLTGAGFGGCVVALCDPDVDPRPVGLDGWIVEPARGAYAEVS